MTNLEFLKSLGDEKLQDLFGWTGTFYLCNSAYYAKEGRSCSLRCSSCPLANISAAIYALAEEHKEKVELTNFERALFKVYPNKDELFCDTMFFDTKKYGEFFLGIPRVDMTIKEILELDLSTSKDSL